MRLAVPAYSPHLGRRMLTVFTHHGVVPHIRVCLLGALWLTSTRPSVRYPLVDVHAQNLTYHHDGVSGGALERCWV